MIDFVHEEAVMPEGWFSQYDMAAIYPALIESKRNHIYLEIGVDRGRSLAFAKKFFKGSVYGIDVSTQEQRGGKPVPGTYFIHADSLEAEWTKPIKVLFIDGEHRYERVKGEWEKYSPYVEDGWVFFHDADDSSPEVKQFVDEIGATHNPDKRSSMAWIRHV